MTQSCHAALGVLCIDSGRCCLTYGTPVALALLLTVGMSAVEPRLSHHNALGSALLPCLRLVS